jgi:hypothetical protein
VRTIQRVCQKRLGLPSRWAAKKPLLRAKMVKKRIVFCKILFVDQKRLGEGHVQ